MASLSVEELALLAEQTIESGNVAAAGLEEDSGRRQGVYRKVETRGEILNWHQALVMSVDTGERQSMIPM